MSIVGHVNPGRNFDAEGNPKISLARGLTAFGDIRTAELTPQVQLTFPYNINSDIITSTVTGSGTVTQANGMAVISTTAATSSSAQLRSKGVVHYRAGLGGMARFTAVFTTGVANSSQIAGIGDAEDGFFFGYNGTDFGIMRRSNASGSIVDTWIAQTSWNVDLMDGTASNNNFSGLSIDATKGNVFEIRYQWLGFGVITFCIEHPSSGDIIEVHRIQYSNANTQPSLAVPFLPLCIMSSNTTNNTNIVVKSSSLAGFVEGKSIVTGPHNAVDNSKTTISTETNVLTIQNKATYQSKTNKIIILPAIMSVAVDGTKNATVRLIRNTALGGTPSYSDVGANTSVVSFDTAGTTITGGTVLLSETLAKVDSFSVNLSEVDIPIFPSDILTISVESSANTDADASIVWQEDF